MEMIGFVFLTIVLGAVFFYLGFEKKVVAVFKEWCVVIKNRKKMSTFKPVADHIKIHSNGSWSVDVNKLLAKPEVQRQIEGMNQLFKRETLRALNKGCEPPLMVGRGRYTKETLLEDWDESWQKEADDLGIKL